jgi:hypothetical protein
METKEELLRDIQKLMAYGKKEPEIAPTLLEYLDYEALVSIRNRLTEKTSGLKEEDIEWLRQFRKTEA